MKKFLFAMLFACVCFAACSDDDNNGNDGNTPEGPNGGTIDIEIDEHVRSLSSVLFDTNWKHSKTETFENGKLKQTHASTGLTLNLSSRLWEYNTSSYEHQEYIAGVNGKYGYRGCPATWYIDDNGLQCRYSFILYDLGYTASDVGAITAIMPTFMDNTSIYRHTSSELVIKCPYSTSYELVYFTAAGSGDPGDPGNPGSGEKPEIGYWDYTAGYTTLTVQYKIYNYSDAAKVTSAKIYYGTDSPSKSVNATVSGTMITARISGLTAGTTYYVKCSATSSAGTSISETTRCMTNG